MSHLTFDCAARVTIDTGTVPPTVLSIEVLRGTDSESLRRSLPGTSSPAALVQPLFGPSARSPLSARFYPTSRSISDGGGPLYRAWSRTPACGHDGDVHSTNYVCKICARYDYAMNAGLGAAPWVAAREAIRAVDPTAREVVMQDVARAWLAIFKDDAGDLIDHDRMMGRGKGGSLLARFFAALPTLTPRGASPLPYLARWDFILSGLLLGNAFSSVTSGVLRDMLATPMPDEAGAACPVPTPATDLFPVVTREAMERLRGALPGVPLWSARPGGAIVDLPGAHRGWGAQPTHEDLYTAALPHRADSLSFYETAVRDKFGEEAMKDRTASATRDAAELYGKGSAFYSQAVQALGHARSLVHDEVVLRAALPLALALADAAARVLYPGWAAQVAEAQGGDPSVVSGWRAVLRRQRGRETLTGLCRGLVMGEGLVPYASDVNHDRPCQEPYLGETLTGTVDTRLSSLDGGWCWGTEIPFVTQALALQIMQGAVR